MSCDTKSILVQGWKLLQVDFGVSLQLRRVFRELFGVVPDPDRSAGGFHFRIDKAMRGIVIASPHPSRIDVGFGGGGRFGFSLTMRSF